MAKGHKAIGREMSKLSRAGKTPKQAFIQAHAKARRGELGTAAKGAAGGKKK